MIDSLPRTVLIMAGGTGGHVFPALAVAECLRTRGINVEWLGTQRGIESRLVPEAGFTLHCISVSGLRGKGVSGLVKGLFNLLKALIESVAIVCKLKPICVLGLGGFAAGPGGLVSFLLRRPLVIHEQNSVPGTTNKLLSRLAKRVLLGYPVSLGGAKSRYVGNPVRSEIAAISPPDQRLANRGDQLKLLVLGGSLGAKPLNDLLPDAMASMSGSSRPEVWHQTGELHIDQVKLAYQQRGLAVKVEAFISDMAAAYDWADVVLCRAGALTVAELTAAGVACILVPLPHAIDDHQTGNARWLADNGAGLLAPQSTLGKKELSDMLLSFDREKILSMSLAARSLAKVDAAEQVADTCLEVALG